MNEVIEDVTRVDLEQIPDIKTGRNTERMMLSLPREDYQKLRRLKHEKGKDPQELIRMLVHRCLQHIEV